MNIRLFSTSTIYGSGYLDYCENAVSDLFVGKRNILFIPYARPGGISHGEYSKIAAAKFEKLGFNLSGIHEHADPKQAVRDADGLFIGGGNTFLLLSKLYENGLIDIIKEEVRNGKPYMGTSAGSNVAGKTISTTNDMPIIYPPSYEAIGLVNFNLNPHYLDPDVNSKHKGETRETRIKEFHVFHDIPVIGLREGSWLSVKDNEVVLEGTHSARIFKANENPTELPAGSRINNFELK